MFNLLKIYSKNHDLVCSLNHSFSLYSFYKYEKESYDQIIISPNNSSCFLSILTFKNGDIIKELNFGDKYMIKKASEGDLQKTSRYNIDKDTMYSKVSLSINDTSIEKDRHVDSKGRVEHNLHFKISDNKLNELIKKAKNE